MNTTVLGYGGNPDVPMAEPRERTEAPEVPPIRFVPTEDLPPPPEGEFVAEVPSSDAS